MKEERFNTCSDCVQPDACSDFDECWNKRTRTEKTGTAGCPKCYGDGSYEEDVVGDGGIGERLCCDYCEGTGKVPPPETPEQASGEEEPIQKLCDIIDEAIRHTPCRHWRDGDDGTIHYVDVLTPPNENNITTGSEEVENIVEGIYFALRDSKFLESYTRQALDQRDAELRGKLEAVIASFRLGIRDNPYCNKTEINGNIGGFMHAINLIKERTKK